MRGKPGFRGNGSEFAQGMSLAFEFAGAVLLFWLVGRFIDNRFGTEPWGQVVGSVVGWIGGFLHVYYKAKGAGWQTVPGSRRPGQDTRQSGGTSTRTEESLKEGDQR